MDHTELANIVKDNTKPEAISFEKSDEQKVQAVLVPNGMKLKSTKELFDELKVKPDRRKGTIHLTRTDSFVEVVNRFKSKESVIFANASVGETTLRAEIKAIFDYHPAGEDVTNADNGGHKAVYNFPTTHEFQKWLSTNMKNFDQSEFAYFLEKNVNNLVEPSDQDKALVAKLGAKFADPIDMLELSRDLEIYSKEEVVAKHKTSSGERELKFTTQHTDSSGAPLSIPDCFVIKLPIFEGGVAVRIVCQLRYRKREGKVTWHYEMYDVACMLEQAFDASCKQIQAAVEIPLYHGQPE